MNVDGLVLMLMLIKYQNGRVAGFVNARNFIMDRFGNDGFDLVQSREHDSDIIQQLRSQKTGGGRGREAAVARAGLVG